MAAGFFFVALALGARARNSRAQEAESSTYSGISVQASPQVFATMAALEAAGYDVGPSALASESPAQIALRNQLLAAHGPAIDALRTFYREHALEDPGETLSPYITFAIIAGPPPAFHLQGERESLPPGISSIDGFEGILSGFYSEEQLDLQWAELAPQYEPAVTSYRLALARTVTIVNAYLREVLRPSSGRTFTVDFEPLVGARTNFRNFGSNYTLVVGPPSEASADAIRHAYLHFLIDPLVLRNRLALEKRRTIVDVAARAPQLPTEYQEDIVGLLAESLIKAVELRLNRLNPDQLQAALNDEDNSGFVLVRPLVDQLKTFEKAEPAMTYYFGDIVQGIDVDAQRVRLQALIAQASAPGASPPQPPTQPAQESHTASQLEQWLTEGDRQVSQRNGAAAAEIFQRVLSKYPDEPRALYGLAIADVISGKAEDARDLFEKLVSVLPASGGNDDPAILAWSHVYLGRIHDLSDERDEAVKEYQAARAVQGAPPGATQAAKSGIEDPYKPARSGGNP
jgi:Tetratricopeptide repeat